MFKDSFNVAHLLEFHHQPNFPSAHDHLLSNALVVGIGGLKWPTAQNELKDKCGYLTFSARCQAAIELGYFSFFAISQKVTDLLHILT